MLGPCFFVATAYVIPELGYSMTRSVSAVGEKKTVLDSVVGAIWQSKEIAW
jgi:hypothetical protein